MKGGQKKADWPGTLEPKEHQSGEFPAFYFASYIPDLELKKTATQKCQQVQTALNKAKACSLAEEAENGQLSKTENF